MYNQMCTKINEVAMFLVSRFVSVRGGPEPPG